MALFVAIGHGDQDGYVRTAQEVRGAAHAHGAEPEAVDDAVRQVAGTPCAVVDGVVEVWPLVDR